MLVIAGTSAEQPIIYYEHAFKYVGFGGQFTAHDFKRLMLVNYIRGFKHVPTIGTDGH